MPARSEESAFLCSQSRANRVLPECTPQLCYAGNDQVMRSRYFWCITLFLLCHAQMQSQLLTNALPAPNTSVTRSGEGSLQSAEEAARDKTAPASASPEVPDDPSQQMLPVARPEPAPPAGVPVRWEAREQIHAGDISTLNGEVVLYYKNYTLHADKIV